MIWLANLVARLTARRRPPEPAPAPQPPPVIVSPGPVTVADLLLSSHNTYRAASNLPPLKLNTQLLEIARSHSTAMARSGIVDHYVAGDGSFQRRVRDSQYSYAAAGENIAFGCRNIPTTMAQWWGSPAHRANLLGNYTDFGGAMTESAAGRYWTTVFGRAAVIESLPGSIHLGDGTNV